MSCSFHDTVFLCLVTKYLTALGLAQLADILVLPAFGKFMDYQTAKVPGWYQWQINPLSAMGDFRLYIIVNFTYLGVKELI